MLSRRHFTNLVDHPLPNLDALIGSLPPLPQVGERTRPAGLTPAEPNAPSTSSVPPERPTPAGSSSPSSSDLHAPATSMAQEPKLSSEGLTGASRADLPHAGKSSTAPASTAPLPPKKEQDAQRRLNQMPANAASPATANGRAATSSQQGRPTLRYPFPAFSSSGRKEYIEKRTASPQADGPYEDVLLPGEYPPEFLQSPEFRAAVVDARKGGGYVKISKPGAPEANRLDMLLYPHREYHVMVVSPEFAAHGPVTYREVFDGLWMSSPIEDEGSFSRVLAPWHGKLTQSGLLGESATTIIRLNLERINRLVGVIRGEFIVNSPDHDGRLPQASERLQQAYEELDRRTQIVTKMMSLCARMQEKGNG